MNSIPSAVFRFLLTWNNEKLWCREVTGCDPVTINAEGAMQLTLRDCVFSEASGWRSWIQNAAQNKIEKLSPVKIIRLNKNGTAEASWTVKNISPLKTDQLSPMSDRNVHVDTIELTHTGVSADPRPAL